MRAALARYTQTALFAVWVLAASGAAIAHPGDFRDTDQVTSDCDYVVGGNCGTEEPRDPLVLFGLRYCAGERAPTGEGGTSAEGRTLGSTRASFPKPIEISLRSIAATPSAPIAG